MGGRRGNTSMMYEVIVSLLLIALFAIATLTFITRNANGEIYFSKFYATDIATSAEVVNAGYGDVILRYDNIKPGMNLRFWNKNGEVKIGKTTVEVVSVTSDYYGHAQKQQLKDFDYPSYLVLRKIEGTFTIQDMESAITSCPTLEPQVPLDKAVITLVASDAATKTFKDVLKDSPVQYGDNGNIRITLQRSAATENTLTFTPTSVYGKAYSCHVQQQLERVSVTRFKMTPPTVSGNDFVITVSLALKGDEALTDEQIGRALGLALAGYYR